MNVISLEVMAAEPKLLFLSDFFVPCKNLASYLPRIPAIQDCELPDGTDEFINYPAGTNFEVAANSGFDVKTTTDTAYQCEYL